MDGNEETSGADERDLATRRVPSLKHVRLLSPSGGLGSYRHGVRAWGLHLDATASYLAVSLHPSGPETLLLVAVSNDHPSRLERFRCER